MITYKANRARIQHVALEHGIAPNAHAIAEAAGINPRTFSRVLSGGAVSSSTIALLVRYFGGDAGDYFDIVPEYASE